MISKLRYLCFLFLELIVSLCCVDAWGLPAHKFSQFTSDDGLDEFVVQDMLQARDGLMWFATWDGLYSFDGYRFHLHKSGPEGYNPINQRFDQLSEAPDGTLWMVAYDGVAYRYNPVTSQFSRISPSGMFVNELQLTADGHCWILTDQQDLLEVHTNESEPEIIDFYKQFNIARPSRLNSIFTDSKNRHWFLTEEGCYLYDHARESCEQVTDQASYNIIECKDGFYWGGRKGSIFHLREVGGEPESIHLDTKSSCKRLVSSPDGSIVVLTAKDGFYIYHPDTGALRHVNTSNCPALQNDVMRDAFVDSYGTLWIRNDVTGTFHYDPATGTCRRHQLRDTNGNPIVESRADQLIVEDCHHNLWIHPSGGGLGWYNRETDQLELFYNPQNFKGWNNASRIISLKSDNQGNLWFSNSLNGLEMASFQRYPFQLARNDSPDSDDASNNVRGSFQDADGLIWAACKDLVIRVYDSNHHFVGSLCSDGVLRKERKERLGVPYAFMQSRDGTLWIGTKGQGLYMLQRQAPEQYSMRHFLTSDQDVYSLGSNQIYDLYEDGKGRIWIATYQNGVNVLDRSGAPDSYRFYNTHNDLSSYPLVQSPRTRCVQGDGRGNVWIGTTNGLLRCKEDFSQPSQLRFSSYHHEHGDSTSITSDDISDLLFTPDGRSFVSTFGGGVCEFFPQPDGAVRFARFADAEDETLGNMMYSMVLDKAGDLWLVGENAISRVKLQTADFMHFDQRLLPSRLAFNEGQSICLQNGQLVFPTVRGALLVFPDSLKTDSFVPSIHFTDRSIRLEPSARSFIAEFSALDYSLPEAINYAYRLVGFEEDWHYVGHQHNATYTNLPPGNYQLEVRSTNSSGEWLDNVATLPVEAIPAFGETVWAKVLWTALAILFFVFLLVVSIVIIRLRQRVDIEEKVSEIKLKFFTDISHELRIPLTLITGPLDQIRQRPDLSPQLSEQLSVISSNATHMSRLVNQILDFSRIEKGKMQLTVQPVDVVPFVEDHVRRFTLLAQTTHILLHFDPSLPTLTLWADTDKLMQIIDNLLGNAFKYTQAGHGIFVKVGEENGHAVIQVRDEGVGIAKERLGSLFERFGRSERFTPSGLPSSGIGLSLTREFIHLHKGEIDVQSKVGQGTCVTVYLPLGRDHFPAGTEFLSADAAPQPQADAAPETVAAVAPDGAEASQQPSYSILVVEDNADLRAFICRSFAPYFQVYEAADGREGLRSALQNMPDLVISDVLMPLMDGFQLAFQMRNQPELSHIPIILLTALGDDENKVRGMECGIDDYITKPFSAAYLLARVNNILQKRQLLQRYYQESLLSGNVQDPADVEVPEGMPHLPEMSSADQRFLSLVISHLQQHLSDADYSVDTMAEAANMSRSTFGRKVRALMGQAPVDLLRDMRLQRAASLIDGSEMTIAQIAYEVGFNDPHYFGKCFKAFYQMTPTEYKQREK